MTDQSSAQLSPARKAAAYWFSDGLPEILFGLIITAWGLIGVVSRQFEPRSWQRMAVVLVPGLATLAVLGTSVGFRVLNWFKQRITFPRTGYVRPPQPGPHPAMTRRFELITLFAGRKDENTTSFRDTTVMLLVWVGMWSDGPFHSAWQCGLAGAVLALAIYLFNRTSERPYRWWSAVLLAAAVAVLPFTPTPVRYRQHAVVICAGLWMLAHGAVRLALYLRRNPLPPASEAHA